MRTHARLTAAAAVAATVTALAGLAQAAPASGATGSDHRSLVAAAIASAKSHVAATRFGTAQGLTAVGTIVDADGTSHVRLHRTYRGLEVVGGDLVVHQDRNDAWKGTSQTLDKDLTLSTTPLVAKPDSGTLVVDATGATPRLAWRTVTGGVQSDGTPSRLETYVDARTGALIRSEQQVETADGSGQSLYSGTVPLSLTLSGSTYQLKDPTRGNTYTTDMANATDGVLCQLFGSGCKTGTLFTSPDNSFGNGTTSSRESAAVDAQYGTNETWDFYKTTFGRNGIFG
ncbi:MAG: peptidase M4 family protein, partial [Propionibacteriales bacterium]|nr:peptidase M4 family protein [Propionibacteriales bacterium]